MIHNSPKQDERKKATFQKHDRILYQKTRTYCVCSIWWENGSLVSCQEFPGLYLYWKQNSKVAILLTQGAQSVSIKVTPLWSHTRQTMGRFTGINRWSEVTASVCVHAGALPSCGLKMPSLQRGEEGGESHSQKLKWLAAGVRSLKLGNLSGWFAILLCRYLFPTFLKSILSTFWWLFQTVRWH